MGKRNAKGILLIGRMPQSGVTIYEKQGKTVVRSAHNSSKPRRCTLKQFIQRQRMRHSIALWHELLCCDPMFTEHQSTAALWRLPIGCLRFLSTRALRIVMLRF